MPTLYLPTRWLVTADPSIDDPDVFPTLIGQSFLVAKTPTWLRNRVGNIDRRSCGKGDG